MDKKDLIPGKTYLCKHSKTLHGKFGTKEAKAEGYIECMQVSRIGIKYVIDDRGTRYCQEPYLKEGLVESAEYGERAYIFTKMEEAKSYIEKHELIGWFLRISYADIRRFSLQQLREVKEILGEGD